MDPTDDDAHVLIFSFDIFFCDISKIYHWLALLSANPCIAPLNGRRKCQICMGPTHDHVPTHDHFSSNLSHISINNLYSKLIFLIHLLVGLTNYYIEYLPLMYECPENISDLMCPVKFTVNSSQLYRLFPNVPNYSKIPTW